MKVTCEYKKDSRTLTLYLPDDVGEFLPEGSIGEGVLAPGSVNSDHLQDYIILAKHIVNEIITEEKIANFSISADKLADGSVTTDKIATKAITTIKLDDSCITSVQLQDGSIGQTKIQAGNALITIVSSLPALPNDDYPHGSTIFLTTDNKLYRSTGTTWKKNVDNTDITGQLTRDQLDVLARNRINNLLVESEGSTGWDLPYGCSIVEVDGFKAIKAEAQSGEWPGGINFSSEYFFVDPNEILEFSFGLECPQYTVGSSGLYIGIGDFGGEYYKQYKWSFAEKKWEVYYESYNNCYFIYDYKSPVRRFFKTYILGSNVDIDKVPAPSFPDMEYNIFCMQLLPGAVSTRVRSGLNTPTPGDYWYFIAPQILAHGSYNIRASNILAESITAGQIATNAITTDKIDASAVTSDKIEAGAIVAAKLAAGSVISEKLAAGAILAAHIASGSITADHIAANTITADKFVSTLFGNLNIMFNYIRTVMGEVSQNTKEFTYSDLNGYSKTNLLLLLLSDGNPVLFVTPDRTWDSAYTWDGTSKWDSSSRTSASLESSSIDTSDSNLKQLNLSFIKEGNKSTDSYTLKAIYSNDNSSWGSNYPDFNDNIWDTLDTQESGNLVTGLGEQGEWRYYKIRVELTLSSDHNYQLIRNLQTVFSIVNIPMTDVGHVVIHPWGYYKIISGTWTKEYSSGGDCYIQTLSGEGNEIDYKVALSTGKYKLSFVNNKMNYGGLFDIYVGDSVIMDDLDTYSSTSSWSETTSNTFEITQSGLYTLKFKNVGKNASSLGYRLSMKDLAIYRVES